MMPPITTRLPSEIASTSHSNASSRNRSTSTGRSSETRTAVSKYSLERRRRRTRSASRARRARTTGGRAPDIRFARRLSSAFVDARRRAVRRLRESELARDLLEAPSILGDVDRVGRRAENLHARRLELPRQLERRLPAELHDHAFGLFALNDLQHVLERQRLEVQLVRGVEVGRDGLGVRVDHDRLEPALAQRHAPRARSSSRTRRPARSDSGRCRESPRIAGRSSALRSPRRSSRRGTASSDGNSPAQVSTILYAGRTSSDHVARGQPSSFSPRSAPSWRSENPMRFMRRISSRAHVGERRVLALGVDQLAHLIEEPRIDAGELVDVVDRQSALQRALHLEDSLGRRLAQRAAERSTVSSGKRSSCGRGADVQPGRPISSARRPF